MPRRPAFALLFSLIFIGCLAISPACHDPRPGYFQPADGADVPILRQQSGSDSKEYRRLRMVIRDQSDWARLPLPNMPIDFSKETALVVSLGRMLSDRYAVHITRVWREGRLLKVSVAIDQPPPNSPLTVTAPYCVAIIPRCDMPVDGFGGEAIHNTAPSHGSSRRDKIPHAPKNVKPQ